MHLPSGSVLTLALVLASSLADPAAAQNTGNVEVRSETGEKGEKTAKNEKGEAESGDASADGGVMPNSGLVNPAALVNFAYPHVTTRPRRLAPGESGTLVVVLALNTPAVVPASAAVALEYPQKQTVLDLGIYAVLPAKTGTLETKFKGSPVYDNTVTIELPITVSLQATKGEVPVTLTLKTSLFNGTTGHPMGDLTLPINGRVAVGSTVPRPGARDGSESVNPSHVAAGEGAGRPAGKPAAVGAVEPAARGPDSAVSSAAITATSYDGVVLEVVFPEGSSLPRGGTTQAQVTIRVPEGRFLSRAPGKALELQVIGADEGVEVAVAAWPPPSNEVLGGASQPVSGGLLSVPVTFSAPQAAATGLRTLDFRVTYCPVGSDGQPGAPLNVSAPAVLAVGIEPSMANPWLFYAVGGMLALLLALVVLRALRR